MFVLEHVFAIRCLTEQITKSLTQLFSMSVTANSCSTTVNLAIGQKLIFNLDITTLTTEPTRQYDHDP